MSMKKYEDLRKKRFKEREERFKREKERIKKQKKALEQRKLAKAEMGRIKAKLLKKEKLEYEKRKEAREEVTSVRAAVEVEKKIEASRKAEEKKERKKETAKYFYCVTPFSKEKNFGNMGMNNSEIYTIPYRDIAAVVSDSPMKDYELTEDNIRNHEAALRQVMEKHTVVPVEFGTTIKNEKILRGLLEKTYNPIREWLRLVDNKVELGVKAVLNEDTMFVDPEKRRECVSDILTSLNTVAKQAVMGELFSDRLVLNASFLVNKEDINAFSEKVMELQKKYPTLRTLYSGPWAPYNFVYVKIGAKGLEVTKK